MEDSLFREKSMKVLYITHYAERYGANKSMLGMIIKMREWGVEPIVYLPFDGPFTSDLENNNIPYFVEKMYSWQAKTTASQWKNYVKVLLNQIIKFKIYRMVRNRGIELVHSNSSMMDVGQFIADKLHCPHVWHIREYGWEDYELKYINSFRYVRKKYEAASQIIAISDDLKNYYEQKLNLKSKIIRIYNGIGSLSDQQKINIVENGTVQFAIVGLVWKKKNQLDAVTASLSLYKKGYQNFVLNIVGDGDEEYIQEMQRLVEENHAEQCVRFWGYRLDVDKILESMNVGLMLSDMEAFGRVTIEYYAKGIPVIATKTGANPELVDDNITGSLIELHNINMLVDKMEEYILSQEIVRVRGEAAYKKSQNYTLDENAEKVFEVYRSVMKDKEKSILQIV